LEALRTAGKALMRLGRPRFALEVFDQALALEPADLVCRQQKGLALERLGVIGSRPEGFHEARQWLEAVVRDHPSDGETLGLLGRTYKDEWVSTWRREGATSEQMRQDAAYEEARLREAARIYAAAFRADPIDYYPGINAVTMAWLLHELTGEIDRDLDVKAMAHGVRWAASCRLLRDPKPQWYWARASVAELEVLTGTVATVERAYKEATAVVDNDWFALDSSKQQLQILRDLGVRSAEVATGIAVLEREQARMTQTQGAAAPAQVVLFSGHMVDKSDRPEPRFPESKANAAAQEIAARLDALGAKEGDLGLAQAACGGDLLFAKACLERKMRLELRLPQLEPEFLANSVSFAGPRWQALYDEVKAQPSVGMLLAPEELGPAPADVDVYERANLWLLYTALSYGTEKVSFLCLWDGRGGDGPGGVQHMHDLVQQLSGRKPEVIRPQDLPEDGH
jgi:tetratricopeptide (TPR) repeat protein